MEFTTDMYSGRRTGKTAAMMQHIEGLRAEGWAFTQRGRAWVGTPPPGCQEPGCGTCSTYCPACGAHTPYCSCI